jgi:hypothetical protein
LTKDEIIEMAREAGLDPDLWNYTDAFETFAKLVAAKEREKCAEIAKWHREMAHEIRRRGQT